MSNQNQASVIVSATELGPIWPTLDPFLFCVHHNDAFPAGNGRMGPAVSLEGRHLGQDFSGKDGFSMYHGIDVPGFPQHPHRGFETISIVRQGMMDHADSLGASARFGEGDVQWMTAGRGIVHSETFPLLKQGEANPAELFQIWINLPAEKKLVEPHFTMLWGDDLPCFASLDAAGLTTRVHLTAGRLGEHVAPAPPPNSWAAKTENEVLICTLALDRGARFTLPHTLPEVNRSVYFFSGDELYMNGERVTRHAAYHVQPDVALEIQAGSDSAEVLVLQGRPIAEPIAHYGPFVMNTQKEIQEAFVSYQRTRFGGWPWPSDAPVHPQERGRFAQYADGRLELRAEKPSAER